MKRFAKTRLIGVSALVAAFTAAGAGAATASTTQAMVADSAGATRAAALTAHSSRYGRILFDSRGRALYLFTHDRGTRSTCYGACASAWPPVVTKPGPRATGAVKQSLLGTTRRRDGTSQLTYAGHPLYYYVGDTRPGQVLCQAVLEYGGYWYVVRSDGTAVR